jgi:hypothetical protein
VVANFLCCEFLNDTVATITKLLENRQRENIVQRCQDIDEPDSPKFLHLLSERPHIIVAVVAYVAEGIDLFSGNYTIFLEQGSYISQK